MGNVMKNTNASEVNDCYTYRQILIGLREEFLIWQKKLDELRELSMVLGECDYYYNLYKPLYSKELPELVVDKVLKGYGTKNIFELVYHLYFVQRPTRAVMLRDNNGNYFPQRGKGGSVVRRNEFAIMPRYSVREDFTKIADEILKSDFANMMPINSAISTFSGEEKVYEISPEIVPIVSSYGFCLKADVSQFEYFGRNDILKFSSVRGLNEKFEPLTQEYLDYVSNIEFPKDAFSMYHQELIEKSIADDRPIVLSEDYRPQKIARFEIQDTPKKLVLTKVNDKRL